LKETGNFNPGDSWIGTYVCTKQFPNGTKAADGEQDIKSLIMQVKQVSGSLVSTNIQLDWTTGSVQGTGQYLATGDFDPSGDCQGLQMTPSSPWLTNRPNIVPARTLAGRLSDDRQTYYGDMTINDACNCLGSSPFTNNEGTTCPNNNVPVNPATNDTFPWCYVSSACPDAIRDPTNPGWFVSYCGSAYVSCSAFTLTRICSSYRPSCPSGWSLFNYRFDFSLTLMSLSDSF
jgi:hypothetical protein